MQAKLSSGDLARATGNTVRTIRFYEEQGLLKPAVVSGGGHRRYTHDELSKLRLISDLRELGLSLCEIRTLLELRAGCDTAADLALRFEAVLLEHLEQAERRLVRLRKVKRELTEALETLRERQSLAEAARRCPCAVAAPVTAPRIVKVVAGDASCGCGESHAGTAPPGAGSKERA